MASVISAIKNTVPISLFNRGQAGKIFEEVRKSGAKVVMKNNVAECVLLSPEEYVRLMDAVNDANWKPSPPNGWPITTPRRWFPGMR